MIVTIDPNKLGCGVAVWNETESKLVEALYVECEASTGDKTHYASDARLAWCVVRSSASTTRLSPVAFTPSSSDRASTPGVSQKDLNDLIDVAFQVGAACATFFKSVDTVYPPEWKGTVKKGHARAHQEQADRRGREVREVEQQVEQRDILDAIGIGLWHFGRLNQKVYPGAGK